MALRTSMVRFTDNSRVFAARSYRETVDGDDPPATSVNPTPCRARGRNPAGRCCSGRDSCSQQVGRVARYLESAIFQAFAAPRVPQRVRFGVVEQYTVAERLRIVGAGRQFRRHLHAFPVEEQHAAGLESGDVHAAGRAVHVVQVKLVERQRALWRARVVNVALELKLVCRDVQRPAELLRIEVETQHGIEGGRGQVQAPLVDRDLMAVSQVGVAPGADELKSGV